MSSRSKRTSANVSSTGPWIAAVGLLLLAGLLAASCLQTWVSSRAIATNFVSAATWGHLVGARPAPAGSPGAEWPDEAPVSFVAVAAATYALVLGSWVAGALWLSRRTDAGLAVSLISSARASAVWWCLFGLWEWVWVAAAVVGWQNLANLLPIVPQFWLSLCVSGWVSTLAWWGAPPDGEGERRPGAGARRVWLACGVYILVFTAMNWRLYFNLQIPHGDSAMYEEHLWNLLHGKGFRSYLDQGLFLGEHIQFVHLFLIPLYLVWPSHLTLELAESTALALGAFPVYWMVCRQTGSTRTGLAAALAYLLYTPMQFLDIEIDLKTFRPEAFGIPLLLLTLDQLERRHLGGVLLGLAFTLTVKEDYPLIFGPLGLWIAAREWFAVRKSRAAGSPAGAPGAGNDAPLREPADPEQKHARRWMIAGLGISLGSVLYLWLATRVVMPWFRSGAEIHYAGYFRKFGETPEQIVTRMMTDPGLLFGELFGASTILYALAMLAPVAFLPLCSAGRLAVGLPLFGILCLNELAKDPRHHFHAPLVAIVFWSVAGGLPVATRCLSFLARRCGIRPTLQSSTASLARTMLWTSSLAIGVCFGLSPLGLAFWDSGSPLCWQALYGPSRRADLFVHIPPLIPLSSRVASTDFVHPRFTHHERSYDYSGYRRKVSDYESRVPDDTDFIVIDTRHRYSTIQRPDEVPEYRDHPDQWELMPDETEGFFIVLRRRR